MCTIVGFLYLPVLMTIIIIHCAVDATTTANSDSVISVIEGVPPSVTLSCTSTGAPTPSIVWTLDGRPAPFIANDISTMERVQQLPRYSPSDPLAFNILLGSVTSNLQIINAQYPDHDGVYTCIGTNNINTSSSANITVQVLGKLIFNDSLINYCILVS